MTVAKETQDERAEWDELLQSDGWRRLVREEERYWREQIGAHIEACAAESDDAMALNKMRQVIAAKRAVERVLSLPKERLRALGAVREPSLSRGGV